ncbi:MULTISPECIES: methyl-accepting chemotaxis protein [Bacillaceae]|uniref:methyl-accepting chemotaxis protein n=1 Tax=Bacillaceae TaxID=186817 RepID=UPI000BFB198A|nr:MULTISPECIES: methyl-accepting chemotaxis protein [Bacillaceae]PGT82431.1 methyl-accepting chemotaxis protein [Bacillus sp. AFS040349]UGB31324.1 methyl-accepting chemotaxis protein [Metabacillus sp. B2-18]
MKISRKLFILITIPLLVILALAGISTIERSKTVKEASQLGELINLSTTISAFVHEMQKERGATGVFMGSDGQKFSSEVAQQRKVTDTKLNDLNKFLGSFDPKPYGEDFTKELQEAIKIKDQLSEHRENVSNQQIEDSIGISYYTHHNEKMLSVMSYISKISPNADLAKSVNAYVLFMNAKEKTGIERALMSNVFARDSFSSGEYQKFISLIAQQDTYLSLFQNAETNNKVLSLLEQHLSNQVVEDVKQMREKAFNTSENFNVDSENWYTQMTTKINLFKEVEDAIAESLTDQSNNLQSSAKAELITYIVVLLVITVALILFGIFTSRSITEPIKKILKHIQEIANGNLTNNELNFNPKTEIGQLAIALNEMQRSLKEMIESVTHVTENLSNQSIELTHSANEVKEGSEQIATTMQELSFGAESQATSSTNLLEMMETFVGKIQEANISGENVSETSNEVLSMTKEGSLLMSQSVDQMGTIDSIVKDAVNKVQGLDQQSKEISKLVLVIQEIAEQTNLLSLNAAIEAARAGEHGKGFAVVADEVRKLAEQVKASIVDITNIVNKIQNESSHVVQSLQVGYKEVDEGSRQIELTGKTFETISQSVLEMVTNIKHISTNLKIIVDSSREMNNSIEEIASVSEEAAAGIEQTAASSQQSTSSMEEVSNRAGELSQISDQLSEQIRRFQI